MALPCPSQEAFALQAQGSMGEAQLAFSPLDLGSNQGCAHKGPFVLIHQPSRGAYYFHHKWPQVSWRWPRSLRPSSAVLLPLPLHCPPYDCITWPPYCISAHDSYMSLLCAHPGVYQP